MKESKQKFRYSSTDIIEVQNYLSDNPDTNPSEYHDKQGSNVLHQLSLKNNFDLLKLYLKHGAQYFERKIKQDKHLYKRDAKQEIANWVNQKNNQGFTPLLYAAYNGSIQMLNYLIKLGANPLAETCSGLNVLHLAAQNNKVEIFIHFQDQQRIKINSLDKNLNTPLHWASAQNSQVVVEYILSKDDVKIDQRDIQGQTPLMLATLYGNTRIVRRLLIKGAVRTICNNNNISPYQVAQDNSFKNITKMLENKYTCFDMVKFYYNVKIEYRPKQRNYKFSILFILCCLVSLGIINALIVFTPIYINIIEGILFGIMFLVYFSLIRSPKPFQRKSSEEILVQVLNQQKICFSCMRVQDKRDYHCDICNLCVQNYDHHCTWINNCVGKKNLKVFILFIILLIFALLFIGTVSLTCIIALLIQNKQQFNDWFRFRESNREQLYKYLKIGLFVINIIFTGFIFPVLLLLCVQIKNILLDKTTYERFTRGSKSQNSIIKQQKQQEQTKICCNYAQDQNNQHKQSNISSINQELLDEK